MRDDGPNSDDTIPAPSEEVDRPTLELTGNQTATTPTRIAERRYELGSMLGRGGMGEVVTARDQQIGRQVAIKRMRVKEPSTELVARFVREARVQGRLDHPAIVPVHEIGRDERGLPYFVMKQLSGRTLREALDLVADPASDSAAAKHFSRQRLLRAFTDVCLAIEFAHTRVSCIATSSPRTSHSASSGRSTSSTGASPR